MRSLTSRKYQGKTVRKSRATEPDFSLGFGFGLVLFGLFGLWKKKEKRKKKKEKRKKKKEKEKNGQPKSYKEVSCPF